MDPTGKVDDRVGHIYAYDTGALPVGVVILASAADRPGHRIMRRCHGRRRMCIFRTLGSSNRDYCLSLGCIRLPI